MRDRTMLSVMGKTFAVVLSLPILVAMVFFDVVKLPILILFLWPVLALLDLISVLQGEDSVIVGMMIQTALMGIITWMDIAGIHEPEWLERW